MKCGKGKKGLNGRWADSEKGKKFKTAGFDCLAWGKKLEGDNLVDFNNPSPSNSRSPMVSVIHFLEANACGDFVHVQVDTSGQSYQIH